MINDVWRQDGELVDSQAISFVMKRQKVLEVVRPLLKVKKISPLELIAAIILMESSRRA